MEIVAELQFQKILPDELWYRYGQQTMKWIEACRERIDSEWGDILPVERKYKEEVLRDR